MNREKGNNDDKEHLDQKGERKKGQESGDSGMNNKEDRQKSKNVFYTFWRVSHDSHSHSFCFEQIASNI